MSSSGSDLTNWFDSKLADLQEQIDKLGNGEAVSPRPGTRRAVRPLRNRPRRCRPPARTNGGIEARAPAAPVPATAGRFVPRGRPGQWRRRCDRGARGPLRAGQRGRRASSGAHGPAAPARRRRRRLPARRRCRRHLYRPAADRGGDRPRLDRQGALDAAGFRPGCAARHRAHLRLRRDRADRYRRGDARHHGRHQHDPDPDRRAGRPGHDQGLQADPADRALLCAGRPRRLGDLQQGRSPGAAGTDDRGRRADRGEGRDRRAAGRGRAAPRPCRG